MIQRCVLQLSCTPRPCCRNLLPRLFIPFTPYSTAFRPYVILQLSITYVLFLAAMSTGLLITGKYFFQISIVLDTSIRLVQRAHLSSNLSAIMMSSTRLDRICVRGDLQLQVKAQRSPHSPLTCYLLLPDDIGGRVSSTVLVFSCIGGPVSMRHFVPRR